MALNKLYIDAVEGLTYVEDPLLFGAEIFQVKRHGKPLYPNTTGTPGAREFYHDGTKVWVNEDMPFENSPGRIDAYVLPEVVYVKFKN